MTTSGDVRLRAPSPARWRVDANARTEARLCFTSALVIVALGAMSAAAGMTGCAIELLVTSLALAVASRAAARAADRYQRECPRAYLRR